MEESRLRPMVANYDVSLFNDYYKKTEGLRRKLASQIDCRRFGVDFDEIVSWFDVKFIFVFNRYCQVKSEKMLLGYLINALKLYKNRILRKAYTVQFSQNISELTDNVSQVLTTQDDPYEVTNRDHYYEKLISFLKGLISDNAIFLLEVQLNPPPYILYELERRGIENIHKIPDEVICDYLDLGFTDNSIKYLASLRKEIKAGIAEAKNHFRVS